MYVNTHTHSALNMNKVMTETHLTKHRPFVVRVDENMYQK